MTQYVSPNKNGDFPMSCEFSGGVSLAIPMVQLVATQGSEISYLLHRKDVNPEFFWLPKKRWNAKRHIKSNLHQSL